MIREAVKIAISKSGKFEAKYVQNFKEAKESCWIGSVRNFVSVR